MRVGVNMYSESMHSLLGVWVKNHEPQTAGFMILNPDTPERLRERECGLKKSEEMPVGLHQLRLTAGTVRSALSTVSIPSIP